MQLSVERKERLTGEINYSATKSSGPGGQNVNKVNTSVELRFSISKSMILNDTEKHIILNKIKNNVNTEGEIVLVSKDSRSQLQNKKKVTEKFFKLLTRALTPAKPRKKTTPTLASRKKRLENKKMQSKKKGLRKPPTP